MKSCERVPLRGRNRKRLANEPVGPERTCLGCGRKAPKERLLRFVVREDGTLALDLDQIRPGRGGYLCPEKGCFLLAARRKRLSVRFRREVKIDPEGWLEEVRRQREADGMQVPGSGQGESRDGGERPFSSKKPRAVARRDLLGEMLRSLDGGGGSAWPR